MSVSKLKGNSRDFSLKRSAYPIDFKIEVRICDCTVKCNFGQLHRHAKPNELIFSEITKSVISYTPHKNFSWITRYFE